MSHLLMRRQLRDSGGRSVDVTALQRDMGWVFVQTGKFFFASSLAFSFFFIRIETGQLIGLC